MKVHVVMTVLVMFWNLAIRPPLGLVTLDTVACVFVISLEMVNTAIERLTDLAAQGRADQLARLAKDTAAGAVLVAAGAALSIGLYVGVATVPWRWRLFSGNHPLGAMESSIVLIVIASGIWRIRKY